MVAVKEVSRLAEHAEPDGTGVDPDLLNRDRNEWDDFSVEAALRLTEAADGEVVVVTVGDEESEDGLLDYLAKGADRAIRVWDDSLVGIDPIAVAHLLAAVARRERPDLILGGVQSSDGAHGATAVALAGLLDLPRVAVVSAIESDGTDLVVDRELDGGRIERLRLSLPALLTIQTGINEPRYATLRAIKQARLKPLETLTVADVGLDAATVTEAGGSTTVALRSPQVRQGATMLEGSTAEVAARISEILREELNR